MMGTDVIEQFRDAMMAAGIKDPPEVVLADGEIHRFSSNGKSGDSSGWYVFHANGSIPAGAFGDWRAGLNEKWCPDIGRQLTEHEKAAYTALVEKMRLKRDADERQRHTKARDTAQAIWNEATPATDHTYLIKKQVKPYGVRVHDGYLIIPMRDGGELHSLQLIAADSTKLFLPGGHIKGCYYAIGKPSGVLCICEGYATGASMHEATGYAVAIAFNAGNLMLVAKAMRGKFPDTKIIVCADDDCRTEGNPGLTKAKEAALAIGGLLAVPHFGGNRPEGATDFNDMHRHAGIDAVCALTLDLAKTGITGVTPLNEKGFSVAPEEKSGATGATNEAPQAEILEAEAPSGNQEGTPSYENAKRWFAKLDFEGGVIMLVSRLKPHEYDKIRIRLAKHLGVRLTTLDSAVAKARGENSDAGSGKAVEFEDAESWNEIVNGSDLLDNLVTLFERFVIVSHDAYCFIVLWTIHSYAINAAHATPYLRAFSAVKRCGKSKLLDLLEMIVRRPLKFSSATASSIFRIIESHSPTLVIDEADNFVRDSMDLQGILNDGYRPNGRVLRSVPKGDDFEVRAFSVWGAKAIAGIGWLNDTLEDRCVTVEMKRKLKHETVERLSMRTPPREIHALRQQITRWVADNLPVLLDARPRTPDALNDRAAEIWEPLLAIADTVGGAWPSLARQAAVALSGGDDTENDGIGVQLLADIKEVFHAAGVDRLSSQELTTRLVELEERPWAEFSRGKPLTKAKLSRLLKPFRVFSASIRISENETLKGYLFAKFADAFSRYLNAHSQNTDFTTSQRHNVDVARVSDDFENVTEEPCYVYENALKLNKDATCDVVTFSNPGNRAKDINGDVSDAEDSLAENVNCKESRGQNDTPRYEF